MPRPATIAPLNTMMICAPDAMLSSVPAMPPRASSPPSTASFPPCSTTVWSSPGVRCSAIPVGRPWTTARSERTAHALQRQPLPVMSILLVGASLPQNAHVAVDSIAPTVGPAPSSRQRATSGRVPRFASAEQALAGEPHVARVGVAGDPAPAEARGDDGGGAGADERIDDELAGRA